MPTQTDYNQKYRRTHPEWNRERDRRQRQALRAFVIGLYGGRCACCQVAFEPFLCIDHVNNDGHVERQTTSSEGLYRKLRRQHREGLPLDPNYQVLCCNCNHAKRVHGACACQE